MRTRFLLHLLDRFVSARPRARRRRLTLEPLEDRTLLSTLAAVPVFNPSLPSSASAGGVSQPFVSSDGRYIAYTALAPNLVPNQADTAPAANIYLYDSVTKTTTLVSHVPGLPATGADGASAFPVISGDDRYVAYSSAATDLVTGQAGLQHGAFGQSNVFLYTIGTGTNTLVSHAAGAATTSGNADSSVQGTTGFGLNQNAGRYLLFLSRATNLVPGQDPAVRRNLFLYDTQLGTTTLVSHAFGTTTTGGDDDTFTADISQDGSAVAYGSLATDLVASQTGQQSNVFLYSTAANTSSLVSGVVNPATGRPSATAGAGLSFSLAISADGTFVGYVSQATNLVPGQTTDVDPATGLSYPPSPNVFGFSRTTGQTVLLSGAVQPFVGLSASVTSNGFASRLALSSDASSVAFITSASDVYPTQGGEPGQGRNTGNVFVEHLTPSNPSQMTRSLATIDVSQSPDPVTGLPVPAGGAATRAGYNFTDLSISLDGHFVTFLDQQVAGQTGPLVQGQNGPDGVWNAFVYDATAHADSLLSRVNGTTNATGNFDTTAARVSGNGLSAAFVSQATNLNPSNVSAALAPDGANLFVYPAFATGPSLLSSQAAVQASAQTQVWGTSGDGRYVVFTSNSPQVVPGQQDANADQDTFVFDRQAGTAELVSHVPGAALAAGNAGSPDTIDGAPSPGAPVVISRDGNWIAFVSDATNLVAGQTGLPQTPNVFLFDNRPGPTHGTITLVSGTPQGEAADAPSFEPVIDADGSEVAFVSFAENILAGLTPGSLSAFLKSNVYLYTRATGQLAVLSDRDSGTTTGNGNSGSPSISDDGRYVAFESLSTNLLSGTNVAPMNNVYLVDTRSQQETLVSHSAGSATTSANGSSFDPAVSADGSTVAFVSFATNLVAGQRSTPYSNVFVYDNRAGSGGAVRLISGMSGSATASADGFSDSPALSDDGSQVAFRSGAADVVAGQSNGTSTSNVFLFNRNLTTNPVTLLSHAAGSGSALTTAAAGNSEAPSIDGAGDLVAYLSTATNLVPNQTGGGVENAFLYSTALAANGLLSGQGGSPTAASTTPAFLAVLSRDPIAALNVLSGGGDTSVGFVNSLVGLSLSPNAVPAGGAPGSVVGTLSVESVFAGQFLPPVYGLPVAEANNGLFALAAAGGRASLLTQFQASATARQSYLVHVHVNLGFGDYAAFLQILGAAPATPGPTQPRPLGARLVLAKVGRQKKRKLMVLVFYADTGAEKEEFLSPVQRPQYSAIQVTVRGDNEIVLTARKGKRRFSRTFAG